MSTIEPRKESKDFHQHQCGSCRHVFGHDPDIGACSQEEFEALHKCPQCGFGPVWCRYDGTIRTIEEQERILRRGPVAKSLMSTGLFSKQVIVPWVEKDRTPEDPEQAQILNFFDHHEGARKTYIALAPLTELLAGFLSEDQRMEQRKALFQKIEDFIRGKYPSEAQACAPREAIARSA